MYPTQAENSQAIWMGTLICRKRSILERDIYIYIGIYIYVNIFRIFIFLYAYLYNTNIYGGHIASHTRFVGGAIPHCQS